MDPGLNSGAREVTIIDTVSEFETDETPQGDTEITLIEFHEDDLLAAGGGGSTSAGTLLGRLEDGRIIISQSGDHVTTVAMVDEDLIEVEGSNDGLHAVVEHRRQEDDEEEEEENVQTKVGEGHLPFAGPGVSKTTTFVTDTGDTIEVLTTDVVDQEQTQAEEEEIADDGFEQSDGYVIQVLEGLKEMPQNFRFALLKSMNDVTESCLDLPIFCRDGLVLSNKFLLAAASPLIKEALTESELGGSENCLVVPDISKSDFETFQSAIFAAEKDNSVDAFVVIRTAEVLGIDFPLTTNDPESTDSPLPTVDYSLVFGNSSQRRKFYRAIGSGLDPDDLSTGPEKPDHPSGGFRSTSEVVKKLVSVFENDRHACKPCRRSFVDEASLSRHFSTLHASKSVASVVRNGNVYQCKLCPRTFSFAINLKKHLWLSHTKSEKVVKIKPVVVTRKPEKVIDSSSVLAVRKQEKFDDMACKACGFVAQTWKQLQLHLMDHTNERPFKCDVCSKGFKEVQKLNRHKITHSGVRAFKCQFCGKAFSLLHNMRTHEKVHTGKGHACEYCGKVYSQITTYRLHREVHRKKGHKPTNEASLLLRQRLNTSRRGRPSLAEVFTKKKLMTASASIADDSNIDDTDDASNIDDGSLLTPGPDDVTASQKTNAEPDFGVDDADVGSVSVVSAGGIIAQCLEVVKMETVDFMMSDQ